MPLPETSRTTLSTARATLNRRSASAGWKSNARTTRPGFPERVQESHHKRTGRTYSTERTILMARQRPPTAQRETAGVTVGVASNMLCGRAGTRTRSSVVGNPTYLHRCTTPGSSRPDTRSCGRHPASRLPSCRDVWPVFCPNLIRTLHRFGCVRQYDTVAIQSARSESMALMRQEHITNSKTDQFSSLRDPVDS